MCDIGGVPIFSCTTYYSVNGSTALHSISAPSSVMDSFSHCTTQTLNSEQNKNKNKNTKERQNLNGQKSCWLRGRTGSSLPVLLRLPAESSRDVLMFSTWEEEERVWQWWVQSLPFLHLLLHRGVVRKRRRRRYDCPDFRKNRWCPSEPPLVQANDFKRSKSSHDSIFLQRFEQHRVLDIVEDPADVAGVGGTGEVWVKSLPLHRLVTFPRLLLVHLTDELLGFLWVLPLACYRGEKEMSNGSG